MHNATQADLDKLETCFFECDEDLASCSRNQLRASGIARHRTETNCASEASTSPSGELCGGGASRGDLPLGATTTAADPKRDARVALNRGAASVGNRAPPHRNCASEASTSPSGKLCGGGASGGVLSSARDDDGGGSKARCASSSKSVCGDPTGLKPWLRVDRAVHIAVLDARGVELEVQVSAEGSARRTDITDDLPSPHGLPGPY